MPVTSIELRGFIVGPIWWPADAECYKPLHYSVFDFTERGTLRDHVLRATQDGDFQNATIAHGELVLERRTAGRRVIRSWPLSKFSSVADCLHPDGDDWCPQGPDDE